MLEKRFKTYADIRRERWGISLVKTAFPEMWNHAIDVFHDTPTYSHKLYGPDYKIHIFIIRLGPISISGDWRNNEPDKF